MSHQKKGFFITFEGPEGAGKSSQIKLLYKYLSGRGADCVCTREPGGTPLAEKLREIVKSYHGAEDIHAKTELLLMEAARVQHVIEVIKPAVDSGKIVLCDRFYDSTIAYQGAARGLDMAKIDDLNDFAVGQYRPDLTILLDLPVECGFERAEKRQETMGCVDRFEDAGTEFHRRVRQAFLDIAAKEPKRVKVVNAADTQQSIAATIREYVDALVR